MPKSTPFLPPIEASTIAKREVGMFINSIPLLKLEATKPPKSVTTPPPKFMSRLLLSAPFSESSLQSATEVEIVLCLSPADMVNTSGAILKGTFFRKSSKQWVLVLVSVKTNTLLGHKFSRMFESVAHEPSLKYTAPRSLIIFFMLQILIIYKMSNLTIFVKIIFLYDA